MEKFENTVEVMFYNLKVALKSLVDLAVGKQYSV